jgi:hypothetical protein
MKRLLFAAVAACLLAGCGVTTTINGNINNATTNVDLSKKNFKVIERVRGTASNYYVIGMGGLIDRSLTENAKAEMMSNAKLSDGSKAVAFITTDTHTSLVLPIFMQKTITVSGYVIEFTE